MPTEDEAASEPGSVPADPGPCPTERFPSTVVVVLAAEAICTAPFRPTPRRFAADGAGPPITAPRRDATRTAASRPASGAVGSTAPIREQVTVSRPPARTSMPTSSPEIPMPRTTLSGARMVRPAAPGAVTRTDGAGGSPSTAHRVPAWVVPSMVVGAVTAGSGTLGASTQVPPRASSRYAGSSAGRSKMIAPVDAPALASMSAARSEQTGVPSARDAPVSQRPSPGTWSTPSVLLLTTTA